MLDEIENLNSEEPLYIQLKNHMRIKNISGKDIAKLFGYTEANISDFLQGKKPESSKMHIIVRLYLENEYLKSTKPNLIVYDEESKIKIARLEGQIVSQKETIDTLKSIIHTTLKLTDK